MKVKLPKKYLDLQKIWLDGFSGGLGHANIVASIICLECQEVQLQMLEDRDN